jgi:hypothetical protein
MRLSRTSISAASSVIAVCAVLVGVTTSTAVADVPTAAALPDGPAGTRPYDVSLGDGVVYATWGTSLANAQLYSTPADGQGAWTQVTDPTNDQAIGRPASMDHGTVVIADGTDPDHPSCSRFRVITSDTAWNLPFDDNCVNEVHLGHGGTLVGVQRYDATVGHYRYQVYDAEAGAAQEPLVSTGRLPALVGPWVWTMYQNALHAVDTSGAHAAIDVDVRDACGSGGDLTDVVGDPTDGPAWALLDCPPSAAGDLVVDLTGQTGPLPVQGVQRLGNGFVLGSHVVPGDGSLASASDFSVVPATHDYGAMQFNAAWSAGPGWNVVVSGVDASASGTPQIAYTTPDDTVEVASLSWLGDAPTPADDTTPPTITTTDGSPAVIRFTPGDTPISLSWTASDDETEPLSYDVQVKDSVSADDAVPGWQPVPGAQGTLATSAVYHEYNHAEACLRVRAVDRVGNRSAWSSPRCTTVDGYRPAMDDGRRDTSGISSIVPGLGRRTAVYRFHGTDDVSVASYDVQERFARRGHDFGPWRSPVSLHGLTVRHVTTSLRSGEERCFRARARDHVGRLSGYGDQWCVVAPVDDRSFAVHDGRRSQAAGALGGTVTRLSRPGAFVSHPKLVGRVLWVRARSDLGGCPHVWWGGHEVMNLSCGGGAARASGLAWFTVHLRHLHSGTVRVGKNTSSNWTEVDAVAVAR